MDKQSMGGLIAKMNEKQLTDFSNSELDRVFANCVSPIACKRGVSLLLASDRIQIINGKVMEK
jgi:hypothetical protein